MPVMEHRSPAAPAPSPLPGIARLAAAPPLSTRRALLLLIGFFGLWLGFQVGAGVLLAVGLAVGGRLPPGPWPRALEELLRAAGFVTSELGLMAATSSLLATLGAVAVLVPHGGPSLAAMGLRCERGWWREGLVGLALGPLLFALILAVELACGWAAVSPQRWDGARLLFGLLTFTAVAVSEEVVARGFLLQVLGRAWGPAVGVVGSSGVFGLLHVANPHASGFAVAGVTAAGLVFAWAYLATGRLWLPIAFHLSWNFAQGPLFGFPVSGLPSGGLLAVQVSGPVWATGGAFGPEAGLLGMGATLVAAALIAAWRRADASAFATSAVLLGAGAGLGFLLVLVTRPLLGA
jgi:membrane protease YdiL (CAAX protease family)